MEQTDNNNRQQFKTSSGANAKNSVSDNQKSFFSKLTLMETIGLLVFVLFSCVVLYGMDTEVYKDKIVGCLGIVACVLILRFSSK